MNLDIRPDLFRCTFGNCNQLFVHKSDLNRHLKAHYTKGRYQCPRCGRFFNQAANLESHMNSQHLGLKPYRCPNCVVTTANKGSLLRHRKRHHNYVPKKYRKPQDVIKEAKEKRTGPLYVKKISTLAATRRTIRATTITSPSTVSPSPSPSKYPATPSSSKVMDDSCSLDWNMEMPTLPQAKEVYPAARAGFPLEGLSPTTIEASLSLFSLLDRPYQPLPAQQTAMTTSGVFNEQGSEVSTSALANYFAATDADIADICKDLFGTPVPSADSESFKFASFKFEEALPEWMGPFDFAFDEESIGVASRTRK
ncbi:uncharacterized protein BT62DRAFT_920518 [Guyanagaster necrorhizus]|uniref:C2H2-type domain-containing protein n=1 Tax=Guyanagaster necrorhizus TaxID=856835 RepID=A0A9P7VRB5_9AGAR|nr:uncharacterized protein BT62DRAFT_920518 [Guyanagaster necrorhizus MCA 3950]KAG7445238.1 hypothetical protein BT62DRAFT_920518 [Guyanagaster necrorhizus MCA 3950]